MENMFKSKKQNNQTKGILKAKRERKRKEAEERQAKHDALSLDQKLAKATPGSREHQRLTKVKTDLVTGQKRA